MAEKYTIKKGGKTYSVTAESRDEAINKVLAHVGEAPAEQEPEQSGVDMAAGAAMDFMESAAGIGDELGAFGQALGGSVYDIFNTDKSASEILSSNFDYDRQIEQARKTLDTFEENNPELSGAITGAGIAAGLLVPAKGAGALRTAATVGAEGAAYGALSGREEGRLEGAAIGAALGGTAGVALKKTGEFLAKRQELKADELAAQADEAMETSLSTSNAGEWTDRTGENWVANWAKVATGVSDSITRQISPEIGGRVQRFDETASRVNTQETREYLETPAMRRVLELEASDMDFKGKLLDFARHSGDTTVLTKHVREALGDEEAKALAKYLRWSMNSNKKYNVKLGNNQDPTGYMHTQKRHGLPGSKPLEAKQNMAGEFDDDIINMAQDQAEKDLVRGLYSKGEVNPADYDSVLLTNASRIQNNNRLLQAQEKFNVRNINGGAAGLMDELEATFIRKGISEQGSREARNAITTLIKGQNKSPHTAIKTMQNLGYSVLGGPKTAILNFHDVPVALWNNGLKAARGLFRDAQARGADVERLGIDAQGVGEFVQRMRKNAASDGWGARAEDLSQKYTDTVLKVGFFQKLDRVAKNQTLKVVADDTIRRAQANNLAERWGTYFDADQLAAVQAGINKAGGDINKMDEATAKLYDEILTLGLGQQQLISAAGRPVAWLNNPNIRPLWMMRGFAIKHNHLISEKVHRAWKSGDKAGAAMEAGKYVMLPGASYAAMNVGRNEVFKEDYDPSGEEFMWSIADSVLGPVTLNSIGVGSSYARSELDKDPYRAIAQGLIPPGGVGKDIANGIYKAVADQDEEALLEIVTKQPIFKQWAAFIENVD